MIWFTSDQHYFHANVIKYCNRPFSSVEEMNKAMIDNWNRVVSDDDTVYCLGDFSLSFKAISGVVGLLKGNKILIPGNHDFCHSYHLKSKNPENKKKWISEYEKLGFKVFPEYSELSIPGIANVNLCHLPYTVGGLPGEHFDDKYVKYRPKNDGRWLICGHVHEKWKVINKMINVGVDQWSFTPVSIEEISKIILDYKE